MRIIEHFTQGKSLDQSKCEDALYFDDNFIAVIDGATSKSKRLYEGATSGKVAATLLKKTIASFNLNISASVAMHQLNDVLQNWYQEQDLLKLMTESPVERATASVVIYSAHARQIWMVGDCLILLDDKSITNPKPLDDSLAEVRSFVSHLALQRGKTEADLQNHDIGREAIVPLLADHIQFQNASEPSDFKYAVIDGFFKNEEDIQIIEVPKSTEQIVLASDGYPVLKDSLEQSERELAQLLEDDPLCISHFKATKGVKAGNYSFDDRTYVRFGV